MKRPWMKWYPADWRADPRLRMCSLAARGLWVDLIAYMHEGEPYGHLTIDGVQPGTQGISSLVGRPLNETIKALAELEARNVFSRDDKGAIFSRRMVRDFEKAELNQTNGRDGGNPEIRRGMVPKEKRVRPYKRSDAPEKTRRIFDRNGGKCHWCDVPLVQTIEPDQPVPHNFFHVDHVIAVCDGGTNDEKNLVAACAACNHKRARNEYPTLTFDTNMAYGRNSSDTKAQMPDTRVLPSFPPDLLLNASLGSSTSSLPRASANAVPWPADYRERFWELFPNKIGKASAIKKLEKIAKSDRVTFLDLMAALDRYVRKTDDRPWCNPETWINQERWTDEPAKANGHGKPDLAAMCFDLADELRARETAGPADRSIDLPGGHRNGR